MMLPVVKVHNGQISHTKGLVLSQVNFELLPGEFTYLIGKTGAGKTSFMRTLYADMPLSGGEAQVAGFELLGIKRSEIWALRRKLGIIFQDFKLLTDRSVSQNLRFVLKATGWQDKNLISKRLAEVLNLVGLSNSEDKMPHQLSGGEQQKVVIARALLNDPLAILADEPTGNLDPTFSNEVVALLHKLSQSGTAILMATHDYRLIERYPARIVRAQNGLLNDLN